MPSLTSSQTSEESSDIRSAGFVVLLCIYHAKYQSECPLCRAAIKPSNFITHMGQVHSQVEKYLPDYAKIPALVKGRAGRKYSRNRRVKPARLEPVTVR